MGDPRVRIFIKMILDILFFLLVLLIYFVDVFEYMDDFYIGTTSIKHKSDYVLPTGKTIPLTETIVATFSQFEDHYCTSGANVEVKALCDKRNSFEIAGILFLVFSSLSHLLLFYGFFGLLGIGCGCYCSGFFRFTIVHYIYPIIYAISLVLYVTVSEIFTISKPSGTCSDCGIKIQPGIIMMFAAQIFAVSSSIYYFFGRNTIKSLIVGADYLPVKNP